VSSGRPVSERLGYEDPHPADTGEEEIEEFPICASTAIGALSMVHVLAVIRALVDSGDGVLLYEAALGTTICVGGGQENSGGCKDHCSGESG